MNRLSKLLNTKAQDVINSTKVNFVELQQNNNVILTISPKFSGLILQEWVKENQIYFNQNLQKYGAILLENFNIDSVEKFKNFNSIFDEPKLEYKNRTSPRFEVAKNIYHSTTYPPDQTIKMHSENSYSSKRVKNIIFCCVVPPNEGGQTPLADNRNVLKYLSPKLKEKFLKKGVKYVRNISKEIGLPWQEVFQTNDKKIVQEECHNLGMNFSWIDNDRLNLSWTNVAICNHPDTNEEVWFNHAYFFNKFSMDEELLFGFNSDNELPFNTYFGDGSVIAKEEIEEIGLAYEKAIFKNDWRKGDILFLDNILTSHGRMPFKGNREIIVTFF